MTDSSPTLLDRLIRFCLERKMIVLVLVVLAVAWGVLVAPGDIAPTSDVVILTMLVSGEFDPASFVVGGNTFVVVEADGGDRDGGQADLWRRRLDQA